MTVAALNEEGQDNPQPRAQVDLAAKEAIATKTVADFVTSSSYVNMDFIAKDTRSGRTVLPFSHHSQLYMQDYCHQRLH